jgi:hypothetical protein
MTDHPMTDEKIEPLTDEQIAYYRNMLAVDAPTQHMLRVESLRLLATLDAERSARLKAEKQRDCAHRETSYGICVDCDFDYRTYDADDSKCPTHGEWRDTKLVCPRCAKDALTVERDADGLPARLIYNPITQPVREEE